LAPQALGARLARAVSRRRVRRTVRARADRRHPGTGGANYVHDLVVIRGDPSAHISDIENVEIVFKDGVGYDTQRLLEAANGHYGEF